MIVPFGVIREVFVVAAKTVYPEWVLKYKTTGTAVRKSGEHYYLYKHSSKRVPGKKNPVPNDTYLGRITPEDIVASERRKVNTASIVVREYGFSNAMIQACPESWRAIQGSFSQERLKAIIVHRSCNSYLLDSEEPVPTAAELKMQIGTVTASLNRKLMEAYRTSLEEVQRLDTIYLVTIGGRSFLSDITQAQQEILNKLQISLVLK